ncbi:COPRS isoform 2 [Pan troglodytes]|uniref:COPRS isoform 2 n=2 Tax=Pan troglodytes TaxID=9598 RepID=A0A6D2X0F7_PANTR|nr:COPRS isoform 2 [Pan troglodytes]
MDLQAAGAQAQGAAEPSRGPPLPSARGAPPSPEAGFATADHSDQERETEKAMDRLASPFCCLVTFSAQLNSTLLWKPCLELP